MSFSEEPFSGFRIITTNDYGRIFGYRCDSCGYESNMYAGSALTVSELWNWYEQHLATSHGLEQPKRKCSFLYAISQPFMKGSLICVLDEHKDSQHKIEWRQD